MIAADTGRPLVQHVVDQVKKCKRVRNVIVATDDQRIVSAEFKGGSPVAQRVSAALKSGVKVVACENTMKAMKLTYNDMLPDIGYVPAGVVELMQKQQQGYAYIRP